MEEKDIKHLEWVYERMKFVHNENENYDYMIRFREILEKTQRAQKTKVAERFFMVHYTTRNIDGGYNIGDITFSTSGGFLNRNKTADQIKSLNKSFGGNVVITGVLEITKEDFDCWNEE